MVKSLTLTSITDKEGKLSLDNLDIGPAERAVRISMVVDDLSGPPLSKAELEEWSRFVDSTEGQINDPSFQRHDQGVVRTILDFDADE